MWAVRALPTTARQSPTRLVYGEPPEGFAVNQQALPLERGRTYLVSVVGEGRGALRFRVLVDERIVESQ
ncbi:hypothetical protein HUA74_19705 [Myxococcus sp. CA051A]|uniref:hypothetical protein n=1 Tax=unclassified Myxococcus TaxID=2648731 RepID=UPI00157A2A11|nr:MULTISPECIES: hypothetical protein [unclassified Myxococcus]NTX52564.1 hypothetical protein [Myxococcus sp. CA039A]NTX62877.1 hypothetical protein [Myxococcus sp. CA051A]